MIALRGLLVKQQYAGRFLDMASQFQGCSFLDSDSGCAPSFQVAPNSDGIQKLLAAEQEASRIVAEARKGVCTAGCPMCKDQQERAAASVQDSQQEFFSQAHD